MNNLTPEAVEAALEAATPGPWYFEVMTCDDANGDEYETEIEVCCANGMHIHSYDLGYNDDTDSKIVANARLIAMAPSLATAYLALAEKLAATKEKLGAVTYERNRYKNLWENARARATLAQITGDPHQ